MPEQPPGYPAPQFAGPPMPYRSQISRTAMGVGAPTGLIIAAGIATALGLGYDILVNPALAILGAVLAGVAAAAVVFAYLWLDRWEPEPPRLLLLAWLWGGFAVVFALLTSLFDKDPFVSAVIRAPIVEELAKGAFLAFMVTGVRRRELNTLVDCLVYAGLVAGAFGFIENVLYLANGGSLVGSLATAVVRLPTPFLHPFFTSMTAIGLWFGLKRGGRAVWGFMALGFVGAVALHMLWNGLPIGVVAHIALYFPLFAAAVALAIISRRREQQVLLLQLPGIVASGLISGAEAAWLSTLAGRKAWQQAAGPAKKNVAAVAGAVTELAFLRDRVERGFGSAETAARYDELAAVITSTPRPPVPMGAPPALPAVPAGATGLQNSGATWSPVPGQFTPADSHFGAAYAPGPYGPPPGSGYGPGPGAGFPPGTGPGGYGPGPGGYGPGPGGYGPGGYGPGGGFPPGAGPGT